MLRGATCRTLLILDEFGKVWCGAGVAAGLPTKMRDRGATAVYAGDAAPTAPVEDSRRAKALVGSPEGFYSEYLVL